MKVKETKSVFISYDDNDCKILDSTAELLEELITTMSNNKCDTLMGEDYDGDISITTLELQQALRVLENIPLTEEMI